MREFLLREEGGGWSPFEEDQSRVFIPSGWDCEPVGGWGDFRFRCGTAEVAFSGEEPGWQVVFEGEYVDAEVERMIQVIAQQIERATGNRMVVVPL